MSEPWWDRVGSGIHRLDERFRGERIDWRAVGVLGALLTLELLVYSAARLPITGRFELFLTMDYGANLSLQRLLDQGMQPTQDFFYPYGLLPLLFGRCWFGIFGLTPRAYLGAVAFFHVVVGFGLARAIAAFRAGLPGVLLMVVATPLVLNPTYANLCHALEAVFLILALGSQGQGRLSEALALTTVALFSKPSMPYVYGAMLTGLIVYRSGFRVREVVKGLLPAAVVLAGLALATGLSFGFKPLLTVLVPVQMARIYGAMDFGFFRGTGQRFWLPEGAGPEHYLGTLRGFWIAMTVVLTVAAVVVIVSRGIRERAWRPAGQMIVTTAVLHWAFLSLFFGSDISWLYYGYLLTLGVAAVAGWSKAGSRVVLAVALLGLAADRALPRELVAPWQGVGLQPRVAGLWTTPEVEEAWGQVMAEVGDEKPVFLAMFDNAGTLFPEFAPPVDFFLVPGMEDMMGAAMHSRRIEKAGVVVLPGPALVPETTSRFLTRECPAIRQALAEFEVGGGNDYFVIYRRRGRK